MTKTVADLASRVLQRLFSDAGSSFAAEDVNTVSDYYTEHVQELEAEGLGTWPETAIPERVFTALVDLIAGRLAPDFGLARPDLEASGLARLQRLAAGAYEGQPVSGEYF